jgi:hypothetical protein
MNDGSQSVHASHDMTKWGSTIVQLSSNDRFGGERKCQRCGATHQRYAGRQVYLAPELRVPCVPVAQIAELLK